MSFCLLRFHILGGHAKISPFDKALMPPVQVSPTTCQCSRGRQVQYLNSTPSPDGCVNGKTTQKRFVPPHGDTVHVTGDPAVTVTSPGPPFPVTTSHTAGESHLKSRKLCDCPSDQNLTKWQAKAATRASSCEQSYTDTCKHGFVNGLTFSPAGPHA